MPKQRRIRVWITAGVLGSLGLVAGLVWKLGGSDAEPAPAEDQSLSAAEASTISPDATLEELAKGLSQGDGMALAVLVSRLELPEGQTPEPIDKSEGAVWQAIISSLRQGIEKFSPYGRASAVSALARVLDRFAAEPAPSDWLGILPPSHELLSLALADPEPAVKIAVLQETPGLWIWSPGRDFTVELDRLADWKKALHREVVRALGDHEPAVRASAVSALATLPIDAEAQPAVAYLDDPDPQVRLAVVSGFARRRGLISEETLLPRLWDTSPRVAQATEQALLARGLSAEHIGLGRMVVHPQVRMRVSAVDSILKRPELDPVVWLLFLSHDDEASVRARAVEALASHDEPRVRERLGEMASADPSVEVRQAAAKVAPPSDAETTASLPPLPGSPSLNPRAN